MEDLDQPVKSEDKMEKLLNYKKAKDSKDAYKIVKKNLTKKYLAQFKIDIDLKYDARNNLISAKGKGFNLEIFFDEKHVSYNMKLALMFRPFKKKILDALKGQFKQVI